MDKRQFERDLYAAQRGFSASATWRDWDGRSFQDVLDDLAMDCTDEQWLIVDETMALLADPDYITGEVPCSTPVSPNEWEQMTS